MSDSIDIKSILNSIFFAVIYKYGFLCLKFIVPIGINKFFSNNYFFIKTLNKLTNSIIFN